MIEATHFAAGIDGGMPPRLLVQLHLAMYEVVAAADKEGEVWWIAGAPAAGVAEGIAKAVPETAEPAEVENLRNWILNLSDEDKNALRWLA